ncbi:hypothetical protein TSUD_403610 [Trifolium subterraneum]|uniref:Uncharacterized protein n=1 Tax=Trifolium subterraneum TaxID=3900 RepID=A0A2Z6NT26_TRISU|nr:hypothetical protein TSUD_403610 [Trifolium subterraneum]
MQCLLRNRYVFLNIDNRNLGVHGMGCSVKYKLPEGSIHVVAQQTNLEYLLMLDVDRLLWSFRKTAGLPTPGMPY